MLPAVLLAGSGLAVSAQPAVADAQVTAVMARAGQSGGNGPSFKPSMSADGRYVTFYSAASDLIDGDTNEQADIFVRDLRLGTTRRVSVSTTGAQGNGESIGPSMSADGRYVAFYSAAPNLVEGDTNEQFDVFVRDLRLGTTRRVSVSDAGGQADDLSAEPSISADGRRIAFVSAASNLVGGDTNEKFDVFVHDVRLGTTRRVSVGTAGGQGDGDSFDLETRGPSISADGRLVAFTSAASNLVAGDTNERLDVFVRDLQAGTTRRVSESSSGGQAGDLSFEPWISADGRYAAFTSAAPNLVDGDTNDQADVFVREPASGTIQLVSRRA